MSPHQLDELGIDRGPDRAGLPQLAHVGDGHLNLEVELFPYAGVDDLDRPPARDEAADLLQRPLRGREGDALNGPPDQTLEPLEREREMGAPFRPGDGMDLVQDDRLDGLQHLPRT